VPGIQWRFCNFRINRWPVPCSRSFALIARVIAMRVNLFSLELTSDLWKQVCLLSLDRMAGFLFLMDGCKPFRRAYRL
jgi:hypothetical protein